MTEAVHMIRKEHLQPRELSGIFVPTFTPFMELEGQIVFDSASQHRLLERLTSSISGVSGIFLASNAGQGRDMDMDTYRQSVSEGIRSVRLSWQPDMPVVVGVLRKHINEVIEAVQFAQKTGADAIVLAPGYTEGDPLQILHTVSQYTDLPIILYNNPDFQEDRHNLSRDFIEAAKENPKVIGIKDTSADEAYFCWLLDTFKTADRHVMQGYTRASPELIKSADGMVPVEANVSPEIIKTMLNGDPVGFDAYMQYILQNGNESYGGNTMALLKHWLVEAGIFSSVVSYPKKQ